MKKSVLILAVFAFVSFMIGCTSMSKDTRIIAAQGIRLVPMDYDVIGDTAAEETRTYVFGIDFDHIFNEQMAASVDEETNKGILFALLAPPEDKVKRGAMFKALEKVPQADRILEPRWTVEVVDMLIVKKITVKMTAKAITYKKSAPGSN